MLKRLLLGFIAIAQACEDRGNEGECMPIRDCVTNEWTYGTLEEPLCDVPGSDYRDDNTKVCCFAEPIQPGGPGGEIEGEVPDPMGGDPESPEGEI